MPLCRRCNAVVDAKQREFCVNCIATKFFKNETWIGFLISDTSVLLDPPVHRLLIDLFKEGSELSCTDAINWQNIHDNWDKPF